MPLRSAIFAVVLACAAPAHAQHGPTPELPPPNVNGQMQDAQIAAGLGPWLADLQRQDMFNGTVLVARNGEPIYAGAYGVADVASNSAVGVDTRYPVASIGKAFTHVAVLQLVQQGRLSLDDTVGELIPDYANEATRAATIAQLIDHRGGIADIFGPAFRNAPKEQFTSNAAYFQFVSNQPPLFAPGARQEYCNGCYIVLGEIIARVSGQSYEDYVSQHVFAAAGMARSGFFRRDVLPADTAHFTGRPRGPASELQDVSRFHGLSGSAAGDAYATALDMLAFDNALREHRLLNPEMTAQVLRSDAQSGRATARVGFAGGAPGVNTMLYGNGAWTLVVLTNRDAPGAEAVSQAVFPLLAGPRPQ